MQAFSELSKIKNENTIIFNPELDKMFATLQQMKYNIKDKFLLNLRNRKFALDPDDFFPLQNIKKENLNEINKNMFREMITSSCMYLYAPLGLVYCILHTRKLIKIKVQNVLLKSLRVWGVFTFSVLFLFKIIESKIENKLNKQLEQILFNSIFEQDIDTNSDPQGKILELRKSQYEFYKKFKN